MKSGETSKIHWKRRQNLLAGNHIMFFSVPRLKYLCQQITAEFK
ncbi:hypothetical protein EPYR_02735 [Erwinia pyrifoliae DSM 12163]|nr:hypothetical protein EPYR_02735 [Erwinia pyrifoliae DSM 12163]